MTEQQNLAKAYLAFGLEAGSSPEEVAERYKDLVMAWHSDRYPSGDKKLKAEEEMKKINNARDVLKKHFAQGHKNSGPCDCRPGTKSSPPPPPPPPPHNDKAEEEAARRRNAERAAEAERARKAAEAAAAAERERKAAKDRAEAERAATVKDAVEQQRASEDEALRWRVSIGIIAAWILVSLFSIVSLGVEHVWHNIATSVEQMFAKHDDPKPDLQTNQTINTSTYQQPQAPPENSAMPPPEDPVLDQISEQAKRDQEAQRQKTYDILKYQNDVDRDQKVIDRYTQQIAESEIQIANRSIGVSEKMKLVDMQNQQRNYLSKAQMDMNTAQKMLAELTGKPAPLPIPVEPHVVPQPAVIDQQDLRRRADAFINSNKPSTPPPFTPTQSTQVRNFSDLLKPSQP
ncbi:MAG: J domain-containing protein [Candidatus Obscuribacterales bacterium]|nr:J domain-containing protein [Candidatus Obscuribacterales bacterium]